MITTWLKSLGHEVTYATTEDQMRSRWVEQRPDIVIASSTLNDHDILTICKEIQSKVDALILALDDCTGTNIQGEIRWLEAGADDYLRKPFYPDQLLAHIHALSRRIRSTNPSQVHSVIHAGPISVDLLHNEVHIHHKIVRLTPTESKILHLLASNTGHVCTQQQIVSYVWEYNATEITTLIKPHIYNLRQKIEVNPQKPHYILTVPNIGYMLAQTDNNEQTQPVQRSS
jgi:Response regulators consisting of a CheY-like receiver domain and a winged-helix DNA-binding domain